MIYKYINAQLVKNPMVTTDDRGFRYGDGVFELISIFNHSLYLWQYHVARLVNGLNTLRIPQCDINDLYKKSSTLIAINNINNGLLRIIITRGPMRGGYGIENTEVKPTILIETLRSRNVPINPVELYLSSWHKPSIKAFPTYIKTLQGLNSILSKMQAIDNGCFESILMNNQNYICEVSSGNIFWYKRGIIYTPDIKTGALPGVVRRRIIEILPYKICEGEYNLFDIYDAEAVFITNTSWVALPVCKIDLGNGECISLNSIELTHNIVNVIANDKKKHSLSMLNE